MMPGSYTAASLTSERTVSRSRSSIRQIPQRTLHVPQPCTSEPYPATAKQYEGTSRIPRHHFCDQHHEICGARLYCPQVSVRYFCNKSRVHCICFGTDGFRLSWWSTIRWRATPLSDRDGSRGTSMIPE